METEQVLIANELFYQRDQRVFFRQLTFQLYSGQVLHVIGANGSGKTTLLRILTGLIMPLSGTIMWRGISIEKQTSLFKQDLLYINHCIGMKALLTPVENLFLFLVRRNLVNAKTKQKALSDIHQVLERLDLNFYANSLTGRLSAGQQRRLALAKLLLIQVDCWILDEPFTSLDSKGVALVASLIEAQKHRGGVVVVTSHQTDYSSQDDVKLVFLGAKC